MSLPKPTFNVKEYNLEISRTTFHLHNKPFGRPPERIAESKAEKRSEFQSNSTARIQTEFARSSRRRRSLSAFKSRVNYPVKIPAGTCRRKTRSNTDFPARPAFRPERSNNTSSARNAVEFPPRSIRIPKVVALGGARACAGSSRCAFKFTGARSSRGNAGRRARTFF